MTLQRQTHQSSNTTTNLGGEVELQVNQNPYYDTPDTETTIIAFSLDDSEIESQSSGTAMQNMALRNTEIVKATRNIYYNK